MCKGMTFSKASTTHANPQQPTPATLADFQSIILGIHVSFRGCRVFCTLKLWVPVYFRNLEVGDVIMMYCLGELRVTPPKFNSEPLKNGWLDDPFSFGALPIFRGELFNFRGVYRGSKTTQLDGD